MATLSDFQRCLESPYLARDPAATHLVPGDLEKAKKWLGEATARTDPADKVLMAYQSMYKSAEALLHAKEYKTVNFRCLLIALEELYAQRQELIDGTALEQLVKAQELLGTVDENLAAAENWLIKAALAGAKQAK